MNKYLSEGYELRLKDEIFVISSMIGEGASSVAYLTVQKSNGIRHILKEYNPTNLIVERGDSGEFLIEQLSDSQKDRFYNGLKHFCDGAERQIQLRNEFESITNYVTNINQVVECVNNTAYIDMTMFMGESYDKCAKEENLQNLFKHIRAIAVAVNSFHEKGYLHLDVKPANVFILKDVSEFVFLFDFDSVTKKDDIDRATMVSYSENWAAPEQVNSRLWGKIGEWTDIYSIGEILFYKLFGRHSTFIERRYFSKYNFENVISVDEVDNNIKNYLTDLFHHTLVVNEKKRYQNIADLIKILDKLIELSAPKREFLISSNSMGLEGFIGRKKEINLVEHLFKENNIVCISGIGGIGKSELARRFVSETIENYDASIILIYNDSWIQLVADGISRKIANFELLDGEKPEETFQRVMESLRNLVNERTLIVVDNVDESAFGENELEYRNALFDLPCKFLLTSRQKSLGFATVEVGRLEDSEIVELFALILKRQISKAEIEYINKFIEHYQGHTLALELIAKQIYSDFSSIEEKYNQVVSVGLKKLHTSVQSEKDKYIKTLTPYQHICNLYEIATLNKEEANLLATISLLPVQGIEGHYFLEFNEISDASVLRRLVDLGWIDRRNNYIGLHPIIREMVLDKLAKSADYRTFLKNFKKACDVTDEVYKFMLYTDSIVDNLITHGNKEQYVGDFLIPYGNRMDYSLKRAEREAVYALDIYKTVGYDAESKFATLCMYAAILSETGRAQESVSSLLEAELLIQSLAKEKRTLSAGQLKVSLGTSYYYCGDIAKAKTTFLEGAELLNLCGDNGLQDLSDAYNNVGVCFSDEGDYEEAINYYMKAIDIFHEIYEEEGEDFADIYDNISVAYNCLENHDMAEKYVDKSLEIREKTYGENSKPYCSSLLKKAWYVMARGERDSAFKMFLQVEKVYIEHFGAVAVDTAMMYASFAGLYKENGLYEDSIKLYLNSNAIFHQLKGDFTMRIAKNLFNLAKLYSLNKQEDNYLEAKKECEALLEQADESEEWVNDIKVLLMDL